jgi:hypothetical protein
LFNAGVIRLFFLFINLESIAAFYCHWYYYSNIMDIWQFSMKINTSGGGILIAPEIFLNTHVQIGRGDVPFEKSSARAGPGTAGLKHTALTPACWGALQKSGRHHP